MGGLFTYRKSNLCLDEAHKHSKNAKKNNSEKKSRQEKMAKRLGRKEGTVAPGISDLDEYPEPFRDNEIDSDPEPHEVSADPR